MYTVTNTYCRNCKQEADAGKSWPLCKKCESVAYCSKDCQISDWPIHKPICRPRRADETWAIRILSNNGIGNEDPMKYFQHELIKDNHPIFSSGGERCPVTQLLGVPLVIHSMGINKGAPGSNEIAVKLRVETSNGFAPDMWQLKSPGECIVMREDRKPLTMALLEAIYRFISHLMSYPILETGWAPWTGLLNPSVWQMFGKKYYEEQQSAGRQGFGYFFPPVDCQ
ncbi:hypothetical protein GYMLUDRAFT_263528 [Collybiopsis luxurians FD-317 M1]|uniref:MYND-type domain-containing protein n=1 Tax=Collybiopsis luxurians FD-317 M1 TaxID=944289 RepID=A0A0D0B0K6_9AGAR|nr:hypothetical protein GYMLUDRAFT_263528 [Collybiopsis luxurians FD-317 M1]